MPSHGPHLPGTAGYCRDKEYNQIFWDRLSNEHLSPVVPLAYITHSDLRIRGMENIGAVAAGIHLSMPTVATALQDDHRKGAIRR